MLPLVRRAVVVGGCILRIILGSAAGGVMPCVRIRPGVTSRRVVLFSGKCICSPARLARATPNSPCGDGGCHGPSSVLKQPG